MEKKRLKEVWSTLIGAYKDTIEYTDHGLTGDPRKTIREALSRGVTMKEMRQTIAVIAHIKAGDGRFGESNRRWLYDSLDFGAYDWFMEYRFMGDLDAIHTTHLDNLVSHMRQMERENSNG